ncbi:alpha/beta fold hydrolase [Aliidiomarina indica]|uniref:alpha/beta fold hydrolase n=1 Tax=Aliidiomarina indica TaxID=2749147 RepID=UPI00188E3AF7|nr:alpha/beta hydrolase [Aliidiomarina indica]
MNDVRILALHSSQSHSGQWRSLQTALHAAMPELRLEAVDLIGYGQGPALMKSPHEFRFDDELKALHVDGSLHGDEPLVLLGHSYGGALALRLARELGKQVLGIILYEPVAFHVLPKDEPARAEIVAIAQKMDELSDVDATEAFVDYWNHPGYFARLPGRVKEMMVAQQRKVQADFHALLDEPAGLADYQSVSCPVHLLHGSESPLSSRTVAALLASVLPNCHCIEIPAGHMAPLTEPGLVNPHIVKAIEQLLAR